MVNGMVWSTDESCQWLGSRALSHPPSISWLSYLVAKRRGYRYQQDGDSSRVTEECLEFLITIFWDLVISPRTEHHWPPYFLDLSPLYFSFWSQTMAHMLRCHPLTLELLKGIIEDFAVNMGEDDVRKKSRTLRSASQRLFPTVRPVFVQLFSSNPFRPILLG